MNSLIINYGLCIVISTFLSCVGYKVLYSLFECCNLKELIIGSTIVENYDKAIDYWIYFIYIALFFVSFFVLKKVLPKFEINFKLPEFAMPQLNGNAQILKGLQTICSLFYFLLYPNNGTVYPVLLFVIIFFVVLANVDIYFKVFSKKSQLSPFAVAPLVIFFFGLSYNFGTVTPDDYHLGERFGSFYLINVHGYKIFQDISIVHGFNDLIAGFLALKLFKETSLYAFYMADTLIFNLNLLITFFLGWHVFSKNKALMCGIFLICFSYFNVYFLMALSMLKKSILEKPFLWLKIYIVGAFLLTAFWLQFGVFLTLALSPVAIFMVKKLLNFRQFRKLVYLALLFLVMFLLFKDFIFNALNAQSMVNILSGANGYPEFKVHQICSNFIKLFSLLALPCFVLECIKAYKNRDLQLYFIYLFAVIFVLVSLVYALTRIDFIMFSRVRFISIAYLTIFLPFVFSVTKSTWLNVYKYVLTFALVIFIGVNFKYVSRWETQKLPENNTIPQIGRLELNEDYQRNITDLKAFVGKNSDKDDYFLDLTNRGLLYFILDRKNPTSQMAMFNFTSEKQDALALEQVKTNQPKIILISSNNIQHDMVYPSMRLNRVYKWILKNNYKLVEDKNNIFLVKSEKPVKYTKSELELLDSVLTTPNLKKLPISWANSINNFDLKQGKDLVLFDVNVNEPTSLRVGMKGDNPELFMDIDKTTKVLVPLDIYASWVLNPKSVTISADKVVEISNLQYYGRDN